MMCATQKLHLRFASVQNSVQIDLSLKYTVDDVCYAKTSSVSRCDPAPWLKLWKYLGFTRLRMLQACAQAVDFKVARHFGQGQHEFSCIFIPSKFCAHTSHQTAG